jgi:hypothetical protein
MPITRQVAPLLAELGGRADHSGDGAERGEGARDDRAILDLQRPPPRLFVIDDVDLPGGQLTR